jgi:hypothetical protein
MTSSTSASEPARQWRRWLAVFGGVFFGLGGLLFALLLLIDPYDTGRFPTFGLAGVRDRSMRTADASRGRDPHFNAAVVGNSTAQIINPYRVSELTGLRFIQLSIPQTGPREQLELMRWVLANHASYGALAIVADTLWCSHDPDLPLREPFPSWLYGSNADYLANVVSSKAIDRAVWRLQIALGLAKPVDPVGYTDYISGGVRPPFEALPSGPPVDTNATSGQARFPWIDRLHALVAGLPQSVRVVVVVPPVYVAYLSPPGSKEAATIDACKSALANVVADRRLGAFLDFRLDMPEVHDISDFVDFVHYREKLQRVVEDRIIAALRTNEPGNAQASRVP